MALTQILVPQLGGPERGFRPCFADILNKRFSSVCGKARNMLVNGYVYHQSSWVSHGNVGSPPTCTVKWTGKSSEKK